MTMRRALAVPIACVLLFRGATAQILDSANFGKAGAPSLLDNTESPGERKAFAALVGSNDAKQKRSLAIDFVARFPSSWLLARAWQLAAAASVDLNDNAAVIEYGRSSIQLLPENPLLLIAIARAEALQSESPSEIRRSGCARVSLSWRVRRACLQTSGNTRGTASKNTLAGLQCPVNGRSLRRSIVAKRDSPVHCPAGRATKPSMNRGSRQGWRKCSGPGSNRR